MPTIPVMETLSPIHAAAAAIGGMGRIAALLGVTPPTVSQWASGVRRVPAHHCPAIERATGGAVTRRHLRPKDWWLIWPELVDDEHPAGIEHEAVNG